ncbi:hypothetical protein SLEP1_g40141 [Rubroshorea leprosula]|uniref:Pectinesterase n=1 Tax=Rubroshorea leprosula TaxID=152421 RepID=A0AAV5L2I0_9ROSI|nr:hypothetical protein SLEP1_g40141 [Rubroshorea leprosula]
MSHGNNDSGSRNKKFAIIGVSSVFLVAMVVAVVVGVGKNNEDSSQPQGNGAAGSHSGISTSTKAIKALCQSVDYKKTCESSLNAAAPNTTDPKELIRVGFQVAIAEIKKAMKNSTTLKEVEADPMAKQALDNCQELMDYAIQDLKNSFEQLGAFDFTKMDDYLEDLKVWMSGSINYQQTCLDGFDNTTGNAGKKMKEILRTSQHLTSNGLAMVTELSNILGNLGFPGFSSSGQRRLLTQDGMPSWVSAGQRRLFEGTPATIKPDVIVAKDGSGKYKTVNESLQDIPKNGNKTFVIYIKKGVYDEIIKLGKSQTNVMFLGDGPTKTKITGRLNWIDGTSTYRTATVAISADNFMAKDIGFENAAGPEKHQAVALRVSGDKAILYNCQIDGYQDTLYAHNHRQFYRDCTITGTIDFIFGDSPSLFQNCKIIVRKPLPNQQCIITAQGRIEIRQVSAIVLQNCTISGDPEYIPVKDKNKAYLARPWKEYSRTIIMQSQIDDIIAPEGFLPWNGDFALNTLVYTEYNNRGPGADTSKRVKWKGIKKFSATVIERYTAARLLGGDLWIPQTGVPYIPGMISGL